MCVMKYGQECGMLLQMQVQKRVKVLTQRCVKIQPHMHVNVCAWSFTIDWRGATPMLMKTRHC